MASGVGVEFKTTIDYAKFNYKVVVLANSCFCKFKNYTLYGEPEAHRGWDDGRGQPEAE